MTDTERAFVRAICADPADDLPRLVFADWLEEHPTDECQGCDGMGAVAHCLPAPGQLGCVLRWQSKNPDKPVDF